MADSATFDLGFVLVDEGPLLFGMALVADFVIAVGPAELVSQESAMGVVAIAALQQPFVDPVMKWPGELGAHIQMACVTELRRRLFEQEFAFSCMVWGVAVDAGNSALQMGRAAKIVLLMAVGVTVQAARADLHRRRVLERKDLGLVSAPIHVRLTGAVARFTTLPFGPRVGIELRRHRGGKMRRLFEVRRYFVVTRFASICSHVQRGIGRPHVLRLACRCL